MSKAIKMALIPLNEVYRDFKGQKLCVKCWNNEHWTYEVVRKYCKEHRSRLREEFSDEGLKLVEAQIVQCGKCRFVKTSNRISICLQGECECHCRELLKEKHPRPRIDRSRQLTINTGDDVIQIGEKVSTSHRDE